MSFGRPPSFTEFSITAPDRGSFPLDHYGECKNQMTVYLNCLRKNGANSTPCRLQGKDYLECRMTKGLMDRDEWRNLGMDKIPDSTQSETAVSTSADALSSNSSSPTSPSQQSTSNKS